MTYPLSSDVTAGQQTAASHYNNLRADALRLGQALADSANLGDLLARWEAANLTITILGTDRLRVPCTAVAPVALIVNGFMLRSISNVDLSAGGKPSGSPAMWYVFANRSAGSTNFTITVNSSATEGTDQRLIGSFYWDGSAIQSPTIRTVFAGMVKSLINFNQFVGCQGRLSFYPTIPFLGDYNGGIIYLVPFRGNQISFYTPGFGWNSYPIPFGGAVPTIYLSGLNTGKCYDVFAYWDGDSVELEYLAWTNLISRATALTFQDGVYTKSTDQTRLYLGTFTPSSSGNVNDLVAERGLWNYFNRIQKYVKLFESTASWTYNSSTWRVENANTTKILVTVGVAEDYDEFELDVLAMGSSSITACGGIGLDSTSVNSADAFPGNRTGDKGLARATLKSLLAAGCHSIYWLESTNGGSATFYGVWIAGQSVSGLTGLVWC